MSSDWIRIRGAREHNLKGLDLDIPKNKLVVITGVSGSGKSSLAFDTVYAEGQRRYVESLSNYARQVLGIMPKPAVDFIDGLSPALALEQRRASVNPRSTLGTTTEILDFLRMLYVHAGTPHCPDCGIAVRRYSVGQMVDRVLELPEGTRVLLLAPLVRGEAGTHKELIDRLSREGFLRIRLDGEVVELSAGLRIAAKAAHDIELVVDRLVVQSDSAGRIADSIELALEWGQGKIRVIPLAGGPGQIDPVEIALNSVLACPACDWAMEPLEPRHFSFNSPFGACPVCQGLGVELEFEIGMVIPDPEKPLGKGAIEPFRFGGRPLVRYYNSWLKALAEEYGFSLDAGWSALSEEQRAVLLYGSEGRSMRIRYRRKGKVQQTDKGWEGILPNLTRRLATTKSEFTARRLRGYMTPHVCRGCGGSRLRRETLAVTLMGDNLGEVCRLSLDRLDTWIGRLALEGEAAKIAQPLIDELGKRVGFLVDVGVPYLTLDRETHTLSGGELQRIRLATQMGSALSGVLYVLDEPTVGLHARDTRKLLSLLRRLQGLGNTILVVEHDEEVIRAADWVIDLGPGAGARGGQLLGEGTVPEILEQKGSLTGAYLSGRSGIQVPDRRIAPTRGWLEVLGASEHNLKGIDVRFPIGLMTCVTGVSGSGKSTLVDDILRKELGRRLYRAKDRPGQFRELRGMEFIDKLVVVDQSPIGQSPRSNPVTYTQAFGLIRKLFSELPAARVRGYTPGRFSFNQRGGRCEHCSGDGIKRVEMHFLPDLFVPCEVCGGTRYNRETLEVRYKGKNIAEVLNLTVDEAEDFFRVIPGIRQRLKSLSEVGLGYLRLGQPSPTLSGGEAQRIKLAAELARRATKQTLYLLDEPTTGLHIYDIHRLIEILLKLRNSGNTVVVIEHHLDVIKAADWVIDLGPDAGEAGGYLIGEGTPEELAANAQSETGRYLTEKLAETMGKERS
ncbi:MAG: excinuclease ABC subunit UvrA [Verrucomicrobiota bacterium]|nr:excinuclease ABC subunit UvrA [Verrucomicrobiota bacterium]